MKRLLTSAAAAAFLVAGTGSGAQAQSLFDLSLSAGGAYHYNWLDDLEGLAVPDNDDRLSPGFAPVVGAAATFWATPAFGIRTNVAYSPIELPDGAVPDDVNAWFYDLDVLFRPWIGRDDMGQTMSSAYFFVGGGALTANPPGSGLACVEPYRTVAGACLAVDWEKSTVGQGTFGLGFDLMSLAANTGIFAELAGYVYDSPFHTGAAWAPPVAGAEDRDTYGITGRLTAGIKFGFGELAPVVVPPPVTPPPPPPPPVTPPPPPPPPTQTIRVCVIEDGTLREVSATFNPATGDTTVNNRAFAQAYPTATPTYAAGATWYVNNETITVDGREYVKFGLPRIVGTTEVARVGDFQGTAVFAEAGATGPHQVLYVPVRPGCEFQPYQLREEIRVRG